MDDLVAPEAWPEHSEDLQGIIFGQCAVKFYKDAFEVSSTASDLEKIDQLVVDHPLNVSRKEFGREECEKLMKSLSPVDSTKFLLTDLKLELLRQVKVYIERGLDVLKSLPPPPQVTAPPAKSHKRARSVSVVQDEGTSKKQKTDESQEQDVSMPASKARASSPEHKSQKSSKDEASDVKDAAAVKATESEHEKGRSAKDKNQKDSDDQPGPDQSSPEPDDNDDQNPEKNEDDVQTNEGDENKKSPEPSDAGKQEAEKRAERDRIAEAQERLASRRRSRTRRSARSTPEAEQLETQKSEKELQENASRDTQDTHVDEQKEAQPAPENEQSEGRKKEKQNSAEPVSADSELHKPGKRKRESTLDVKEQLPLSIWVAGLTNNKYLSGFHDDSSQASASVLSPTSIDKISNQVQNKELESIDEVEVELLKMVANSVIAGNTDSKSAKNILSAIDSALKQFRELPAPSASTKRRRR